MPSTAEFRIRSRNSVVRRSSVSSSRARVTSRKAKMAAPCSARMPIDATETVMRSPEVVTRSRSKFSSARACGGREQLVPQDGALGLGNDLRPRFASQTVAGVTGHLLGRAIHVQHGPGVIQHHDAVRRTVDEGAIPLDGAQATLAMHVGQRGPSGCAPAAARAPWLPATPRRSAPRQRGHTASRHREARPPGRGDGPPGRRASFVAG